MSISKEQVTSALRAVTDPVSGKDLITVDMVRGLTLDGTKVSFVLEIDPARASEYEVVKSQVQTLLKTDYGVETVNMVLTAHATKAPPPDIKPKKTRSGRSAIDTRGKTRDCRCFWQGRGWKIHRFRESGLCLGRDGRARGIVGRGCLWSVTASLVGGNRTSCKPRRKNHYSA
jgi:metal-sulfur cluster biosynthetic enzyme